MSILLDELIKRSWHWPCQCYPDGKWYFKQLLPGPRRWEWQRRIREAWRVLTGKAQTWHYKDQE
jgi:hypothetical protein